jgi:hypothetical protein
MYPAVMEGPGVANSFHLRSVELRRDKMPWQAQASLKALPWQARRRKAHQPFLLGKRQPGFRGCRFCLFSLACSNLYLILQGQKKDTNIH